MASCKKCRKKNLVINSDTGETVCSSCGIVQDFNNFQDQFGDAGNYVTHGTSGTGHDYSYKERKLYEANSIIEDITYRLIGDERVREVKDMVKKVTEGEYGLGVWFNVLVGACCYIVMRQKVRVLTVNEVCDVVGCELYDLGRMIGRVVEFLGLKLPGFDVVGLLEKTIRGFSGFSGLSERGEEERVEVMVKQGVFLVQCCIKWWLTTGRQPGPVAVAVLVLVAEVNGIKVRIEEVAKEVGVGLSTCRLRYKELLEALVEVAKGLPWGNDINVKNVVRNAPCVIKYMEMKSMENKTGCEDDFDCLGDAHREEHKKRRRDDGKGEFDFNNVFGDHIGGSGVENRSQCEGDAQDEAGSSYSGIGDVEDIKVLHESLANLYSKFKADFASHKVIFKDEAYDHRDRLDDLDFQFCNEWWSGKSELCEKLILNELEEKDVGLNALPPSYIRGIQAVKRRREKIRVAKMRINSIRFPLSNDVACNRSERSDDMCLLGKTTSHKKRKCESKKREEQHDSIDWEDFIIETLLLHRVKEEEIEKGHYKALLGLYVFKGSNDVFQYR